MITSQNSFGLVRESNTVELRDIDTFEIKQTLSIPQLSHECPTYNLCDQKNDNTFFLEDVVYNATYNKLFFAKNKCNKPCNSLGICALNTSDQQAIQEAQALKGHINKITAINTLDDLTVSASTDRTIKLWDLEKAVCTRTIRAGFTMTQSAYHLLPLTATSFLCTATTDGYYSDDYYIMHYDTRMKSATNIWESVGRVGYLALGAEDNTFLTGANFIKVWDQRMRTKKLQLIDIEGGCTRGLAHYKHVILALKGQYLFIWDTTKEKNMNGDIFPIGFINENSNQRWRAIKKIKEDTLLIIGKEYPEKWDMKKIDAFNGDF